MRCVTDQVDDWVELYRYQRDRVENCYDITPKTTPANANRLRQGTKIVASLDDVIHDLKSKGSSARLKDGELIYES